MRYIRLFLLTLLITVFVTSAVLANNNFLDQDTAFRAGKNTIIFKAGTKVTVNRQGHAVKGILAKDQFISCVRIPMRFQANTPISLDSNGDVISGTIANNETISNGRTSFRYKAGTPVLFDGHGYIVSGILLNNQAIETRAQRCLFMAGQMVEFNNEGFIITGTLAEDTNLAISNTQTVFYSQGRKVRFNDRGYAY